MIEFERFKLKNGLTLLIHKDTSTPIAVFNLLYKVGSRHEQPTKTGYAHFCEHLMFEGSANVLDMNKEVQIAGGENNAFTNKDITNYYINLPSENLEIAFWLESDRMLKRGFTPDRFKVQQKVVVEEFNQRYLNQPFGDALLNLREMVYPTSPYGWPTIGKEPAHILDATEADIHDFFNCYYTPDNAILSVAGNVDFENVKQLTEKWFGEINSKKVDFDLLTETEINKSKVREIKGNVPYKGLFKAYRVCGKRDENFPVYDLLSDILSSGKSSRLYDRLVREKQILSDIHAYVSGDYDEAMFIFQAFLNDGVSFEQVEKELAEILEDIKEHSVSEYELDKVKNKFESLNEFGRVSVMNRALQLAVHEVLDKAENVNCEIEKCRSISAKEIQQVAQKVFLASNCSTIYYIPE